MGIVQEDRILFPEEASGTEVKAETRLNSPDLKFVSWQVKVEMKAVVSERWAEAGASCA